MNFPLRLGVFAVKKEIDSTQITKTKCEKACGL